jgi:hypothetical protein
VLNTLMKVADEAFNEHLADDLIYVGTRNNYHLQAFTEYTSFILSKFPTALQESQQQDPGVWTPQD